MIKGFKAAEYNPRMAQKDRVDAIHRAMRRFGSLGGLVVNRRTGTVISGHQRLKAWGGEVEPVILKRYESPTRTGTVAEGYVELDGERWEYRVVDVSVDVERAMNLAANAHGEGGWDKRKKAFAIREASLGGYVEDLGFTAREILDHGDLADRLDRGPVPVEERGDPVSVPGEVYDLGPHRVMCGDSSKAEDVEQLLAGAVPRVTVADPPYVVDFDPAWREEAGHTMTRGKSWGEARKAGTPLLRTPRLRTAYWDRSDGDPGFPAQWKLAPGAVLYVWHSMTHAARVQTAIMEAGFDPVAYVVWDKGDGASFGRGHWNWVHETVLAAARGGEVEELFSAPQDGCYYGVRRGKARKWRGGKQSTIWRIKRVKSHTELGGHGASKPLECYARPIALHTVRGEPAYCPFGGSGTCVMAAESIGRAMFAMEIDPHYVDLIRQRWALHVGESWPPGG